MHPGEERRQVLGGELLAVPLDRIATDLGPVTALRPGARGPPPGLGSARYPPTASPNTFTIITIATLVYPLGVPYTLPGQPSRPASRSHAPPPPRRAVAAIFSPPFSRC
jgi:hypothetical protein